MSGVGCALDWHAACCVSGGHLPGAGRAGGESYLCAFGVANVLGAVGEREQVDGQHGAAQRPESVGYLLVLL